MIDKLARSGLLAVALLMSPWSVTPTWAHRPAQRAEELNEAGKRLFGDGEYERALGKFRQATVIAPLGKYYFNVCFTLSQLKRYHQAQTACEASLANTSDAKLVDKSEKLLANVRAQVASGNASVSAVDSTRASLPEPRNAAAGNVSGSAPAAAPPPPMTTSQAARPGRHDYEWALGFELLGLGNVGVGGSLASGDARYKDGGFQFRTTGTMTFDKRRRLGGQAYLGYSVLRQDTGDASVSDSALSLVDLGVAGIWHIPLSSRLYVTPLAGAHISLQGPADSPEVFIAVGTRLGISLDWVIDKDARHVLSLSSAASLYTRAGGESTGLSPDDFGLDSGGATAVLGLAYTLRFQTPLGQLPIFTLE